MPEGRSAYVTAIATVLAAIITGLGMFVAARETHKVKATLPEVGETSLSVEAAGAKIVELSRDLASARSRIEELKQGTANSNATLQASNAALQSQVTQLEMRLANCIPPPVSPEEISEVQLADDLTVTLKSVKQNGSNVTIRFEITNGGREGRFYLWPGEVYFQGKNHRVSRTELGGRNASGGNNVLIPNNIPLAGLLRIDVPTSVEQFDLIRISLDRRPADFRNVKIAK